MENDNHVAIKINGKMVRALLDTGASASLINESLLTKLKLTLQPLSSGQPKLLLFVQAKPLYIVGEADVMVAVHNVKIPHRFIVIKSICHDLILGADFLRASAAVIDFSTGIISFADDLVRIPLIIPNKRNTGVFTVKSVFLPPFSESLIEVRYPKTVGNSAVLIEPNHQLLFKQVATARSLNKCKNNITVCKVLNFSQSPFFFAKNTLVGKVESLSVIASATPFKSDIQNSATYEKVTVEQTAEVLENFQKQYKFAVSPHLTPEQRLQLLQLLYIYKDTFAQSLMDIKRYKGYELKLDLLSDRRSFKRQYRLKPEDAQIAQSQIDEMHQAGVIEPSDSVDYNSPLILVAKNDNSKRMVIDLRDINRIVAPKISEILDEVLISKPAYFSSLDLRSGYFHIPLHKRSRKVTSFTAPNGLRWQFTVAPFGLNVSPAAMLTGTAIVFWASRC